jgi:FkbM family methyltransferase
MKNIPRLTDRKSPSSLLCRCLDALYRSWFVLYEHTIQLCAASGLSGGESPLQERNFQNLSLARYRQVLRDDVRSPTRDRGKSKFAGMTDSVATLPRKEVRNIRGAKLLRGMNRILPLGRKYHPLVGALNGRRGLLAISFDKYRVLQPAAWTKTITNELLFGADVVPEFQLLKPLCRQSSEGVLIDLGANAGLYTLLLRSTSTLPIIAYEPQPFLFKLLQWNILFNQLPDVETRNIACGSRRSEVSFWLGLNGSILSGSVAEARKAKRLSIPAASNWEDEARLTHQGGNVVKVPVTTLDEDLADIPSIAMLKIDCEGSECEILQGARILIRRHRPPLFIEVHPEQLEQFGHSTQEVLDLLSPDYEMEFWYFQIGRTASKFAQTLAKFRRPKGHRCANSAEMLAATKSVPGPGQIYLIGHPKRPL